MKQALLTYFAQTATLDVKARVMKKEIFTAKAFLPPINEFTDYVKKAYKRGSLTDHGILLQELEDKLRKYLKVENITCVTSATTGLEQV